SPTFHAVTGLHVTHDIQVVPVNLNNSAHFRGGAGNQATINFLSYLGGAGPDSINRVVVQNEGGSNFIYVAGSMTDSGGRADAFVAKRADGETSAVCTMMLTLTNLPGPHV